MVSFSKTSHACGSALPFQSSDPGDEAALCQRRAMALRALSSRLSGALDEDDVGRRISAALEPFVSEVPFLLYYESMPDGADFRLRSAHGLKAATFLAPVRHGAASRMPWPLQEAVSERRTVEAELPPVWRDRRAIWPAREAPGTVLIKPICSTRAEVVHAVLVLGVPTGASLDEAHRQFHDDLCALIGEAMVGARVRADERRRIARDLHDTLGQHLAALQMTVTRLKSEGPDRLQRIASIVDAAERDLDRIILGLRPCSVGHEGLSAAIESFVASWQRLFDRPVDLMLKLQTHDLPADVEGAVLCVVQEALTNVAKHAGAQHVGVILERCPQGLRCTVEDDGIGFEVDRVVGVADERRQWGLIGMRERVEALGGVFQIESVPGEGTAVLLRIPCESRAWERPSSEVVPCLLQTDNEASHPLRDHG